jgi:hypothetical protein
VENLHKHSVSFKKAKHHVTYASVASSSTYEKKGYEHPHLVTSMR